MNKLYTLLFLALFLCINTADAQVPSLRAYQKSAKKAMENKDYFSAMRFYQLAIRKDSSRLYNYYNLGEAARLFKSFDISKEAYLKVVDSDSEEHPLASYWLARVFHQQAEYDLAQTYYGKFLSPAMTTKGPNNAEEVNIEKYKALAQAGIEDCLWAKEEKSGYSGSSYKIQPFGNGVNTAATEFAPIEHQQNMYYSGLEYDKDNFCPNPNSEITRKYTSTYVSDGQTGVYNVAEKVEGKFVAHTTFNGEKNTRMYFTVCERLNASEFDCELFYRNKDGNGMWGDAIKLPDHINRPGTNNTHPNIGFDENTGKDYLFFVSNRADSEGGTIGDLDIYCSLIQDNGQVGLPERLNINTDEDDITPFFNQKENTLYFSSKGYQGFGGFDIFKSKKSESGTSFEAPESMGYYLNSSYDDVYFSTDEKFENAYFASNRLGVVYEDEGLETCCHDIFKLEVLRVDLNVFTFNEEAERLFGERKPITELDSCYVTLYDLSTGLELERKFDADSNYFYFPLELGREYQVIGTHDGRWTDTLDYISTKGIKETTTITRYLDLNPNVELYAYAFDDETKEPLLDVNFKFYNEENGELIYETNRLDDNVLYRNKLLTLFGDKYKVIASKEGYTADTVSYSTEGLYTPTTLRDSLYLAPDEGPLGLTVYLYFDNDEPDSNTTRTYSTITYEEAFNRYYVDTRIEKFMYENSKKVSGEIAIQAQTDTRSFFDDEVLLGMNQLRELARLLDGGISKGHVYLIEVEGSASPRSPSGYNKNLTSRRVSSVKKYLQSYSSNLANAIAQNNIQFELIPRGEDYSRGLNIPHAYSDPQSIYSLDASRQRNVKISRLKRLDRVDYPIVLFYDSNQSNSVYQSYKQSFDRLMSESRRKVYIDESTRGLSGKMMVEAREITRSFFENEVKSGMINLEILAQFFERNLSSGNKYEINIQTSGQFSAVQKASIENYLKRYNGGILSSYFNSGGIQFKVISVDSGNNSSPVSIEGLEDRKAIITGVKPLN